MKDTRLFNSLLVSKGTFSLGEKDLEALDAVGHLDKWDVFVFVERRAKRPIKGHVSVAVLPDFCSFSLSTLIQLWWCSISFGSDFGLARWFCPLGKNCASKLRQMQRISKNICSKDSLFEESNGIFLLAYVILAHQTRARGSVISEIGWPDMVPGTNFHLGGKHFPHRPTKTYCRHIPREIPLGNEYRMRLVFVARYTHINYICDIYIYNLYIYIHLVKL